MRYVKARWELSQRDLTYRVYVTDCLQVLTENTTHFASIKGIIDCGKTMPVRWYDFIRKNKQEENKEDRSVEEIATDIFKKICGGGE